MRDYFWKQRNPDSSEAAASDLPMDPSQYKGRFRLNSPPNAAKAKAKAAAKKDKTRAKKANQVARVQKGRIGAARDRGPLLDIRFYLTDGLLEKIPPSMLGATLDPFDSFNLDMKPEALKLIWYCKSSPNRRYTARSISWFGLVPSLITSSCLWLALSHILESHVYALSFLVLSCLVLPCLILPCVALSCHALSCPVSSFADMSRRLRRR